MLLAVFLPLVGFDGLKDVVQNLLDAVAVGHCAGLDCDTRREKLLSPMAGFVRL
jgi:hypothetical protein